jgi:ergothioneine biosynthesis protein EgtB
MADQTGSATIHTARDCETSNNETQSQRLLENYNAVRAWSEKLCQPLEPEDFVVQSMPDVSPTRWHLAHTTWFFETFVLREMMPGHKPFHPSFGILFNSYYNTVGEQFPRDRRGLLSRPTVREIFDYRHFVDEHMRALIASENCDHEATRVIQLGLQHEQQHQELMLTDIKHVFSCNPLPPVYRHRTVRPATGPLARWVELPEGLRWIGHGEGGFAFDNEMPRHQQFLQSFRIGTGLVTCQQYIEFIEAGGYTSPELWLSAGWATVQSQGWTAPLYWSNSAGQWQQFTLSGMRPVEPSEPVCHVSYFEADAFARWAGQRLPTEAEWEVAAAECSIAGSFAESEYCHPSPCANPRGGAMNQAYGEVWQWTSSPYTAYPGYRPPSGALGEYNGKFMCNQFVLRGGSCATPESHVRLTYRNFFPPEARWQFSGIRLASDSTG